MGRGRFRAVTHHPLHGKRKHPARARTIAPSTVTLLPVAPYPRPTKRGQCADMPRPCPYVGCSHHLYLDVSERTGNIKYNFPDLEPEDMVESCSLDVAEDGGKKLETVGQLMNLTRERVRQIEEVALEKYEKRRPVSTPPPKPKLSTARPHE